MGPEPSLARFVLTAWGATSILCTSFLLARVRAWLDRVAPHAGKLARCPQCAGFWIGAGLAILGQWPGGSSAIEIATAAFASSGACWAIHVATVRMGAREL